MTPTIVDSNSFQPLIKYRAAATMLPLLCLYLWSNSNTNTVALLRVAWAVMAISFLLFAWHLGDSIPLQEFVSFWAGVQWIYAPWVCYNYNYVVAYESMAVDEQEYFLKTIPAYLCFVSGIFLFGRRVKSCDIGIIEKKYNLKKLINLCYIAGAAGFFLAVFLKITTLGRMLMFMLLTGVLIKLYTSKRKIRFIYVFLIFIFLFLQGVTTTMFGASLGVMLFLFMYMMNHLSIKKIPALLICVLFCVFSLYVLQLKGEYRYKSTAPNTRLTDKVAIFYGLLKSSISQYPLQTILFSDLVTIRLNQGSLISKVYNYMDHQPGYYHGSTIADSIVSIFQPRVLFPNKRQAGGRENLTQMIGYRMPGASMNVSYVGEGYANFGPAGCCIFMFLCGTLLGSMFMLSQLIIKYVPIYFFFIPVCFESAWMVEGDLMGLLNTYVKAMFLCIGLYFIFYKKIIRSSETEGIPAHEN